MKIDLRTHPKDQIEFEHIETGERVPCEAGKDWPNSKGIYIIKEPAPDGWGYFRFDGIHIHGLSKWRIVAKPASWRDDDALCERVEEFIQDVYVNINDPNNRNRKGWVAISRELHSILTEMQPRDALAEACSSALKSSGALTDEEFARHIRAELAKRGLTITELKGTKE